MSNDPVKDCLQNAWQALLLGDIAERDKQCSRAKIIMDAEKVSPTINLIQQPDGSYAPDIRKH